MGFACTSSIRLRGTRRIIVALTALSAAIAVPATAGGSAASRTLFLQSNRGADISPAACNARHGCGPEVFASEALSTGRRYTVRVSGTISVWSFWVRQPCGRPEAAPEFPTAGARTQTSDDAQFRFAVHLRPCRQMPFKMGLFQINLGRGWFHPTALGNPSTPSGDVNGEQHPYSFLVVGRGVEPGFRFVDNQPSDNNGAFRIVISAGR
jgi:hypothetical protein